MSGSNGYGLVPRLAQLASAAWRRLRVQPGSRSARSARVAMRHLLERPLARAVPHPDVVVGLAPAIPYGVYDTYFRCGAIGLVLDDKFHISLLAALPHAE